MKRRALAESTTLARPFILPGVSHPVRNFCSSSVKAQLPTSPPRIVPVDESTRLIIPHPTLKPPPQGVSKLFVQALEGIPDVATGLKIVRFVESKFGKVWIVDQPRDKDTNAPLNYMFLHLLQPISLSSFPPLDPSTSPFAYAPHLPSSRRPAAGPQKFLLPLPRIVPETGGASLSEVESALYPPLNPAKPKLSERSNLTILVQPRGASRLEKSLRERERRLSRPGQVGANGKIVQGVSRQKLERREWETEEVLQALEGWGGFFGGFEPLGLAGVKPDKEAVKRREHQKTKYRQTMKELREGQSDPVPWSWAQESAILPQSVEASDRQTSNDSAMTVPASENASPTSAISPATDEIIRARAKAQFQAEEESKKARAGAEAARTRELEETNRASLAQASAKDWSEIIRDTKTAASAPACSSRSPPSTTPKSTPRASNPTSGPLFGRPGRSPEKRLANLLVAREKAVLEEQRKRLDEDRKRRERAEALERRIGLGSVYSEDQPEKVWHTVGGWFVGGKKQQVQPNEGDKRV